MSAATLKRLLASPASTLAEARRIIDLAKGLLPGTSLAKPATRDDRSVESRFDEIAAEVEQTGCTFAQAIGRVITGGIRAEAPAEPASPAPATPAPQTPAQRARIKELQRVLVAKDAHLERLTARHAQLEAQAAAKRAARPATAARPAPVRPAPAPAPAASLAARMTSAAASQIAAEIVNEQERRRAASLIKTRAELDKMRPREVSAFFKSGGKLSD